MATIKDVAKKAGVSVGSVSNVINGKTNNMELIRRVEKAITELDFKPSEKARTLKSSQSFLIGIIVSSMSTNGMFTMLSVIEQCFNMYGYSIIIKSTNNNAILERKNIEAFIQLGVDGIIVDTNLKKRKWISLVKKEKIPVVFMEQQERYNQDINQVCVNYETGIQKLFSWCIEHKLYNIGMILYEGMITEENLQFLCEKNNDLKISYYITGKNASINGFKTAYELFYGEKNKDPFDLILSGSPELFVGIKKAIAYLQYANKMRLVCVKNENWIEDSQTYDAILNVSFKKIGESAANLLLNKIREKDVRNIESKNIDIEFKECPQIIRVSHNFNKKTKTIRVAMLDSEIANILPKVSEVYKKNMGINIEFLSFPYHKLWKLSESKQKLKSEKIDLLMYDIVWKDYLLHNNVLEKIIFTDKEYSQYIEGYIDSISNIYEMKSKKLFGLPLLTGTQLLFCQKDLFEDTILKRRFLQQYGYELSIPKTWNQFLDVAEYFTKKYNTKSPIKYGTAMVNQGNLYNSIEFLNILWEMKSDVITNQKFNIKTLYVESALKKYVKLYKYTNQAECSSWEDIAKQFKEGHTAMVILYDSYAYGINDPSLSKVAGNIESALLPGKTSVLGGWGFGCVASSDNKLEAFDYLKWVCGPEGNRIFSVLAGISSRKDFYLNHDLDILYPWKKDIIQSYNLGHMRNNIKFEENNVNMIFYDEILGKELAKVVRGDTDIQTCIEQINTKANELIRTKN